MSHVDWTRDKQKERKTEKSSVKCCYYNGKKQSLFFASNLFWGRNYWGGRKIDLFWDSPKRRKLIMSWSRWTINVNCKNRPKRLGKKTMLCVWWDQAGLGRDTQVLTRHGCFGKYLGRIGAERSTGCHHCGAENDSAENSHSKHREWPVAGCHSRRDTCRKRQKRSYLLLLRSSNGPEGSSRERKGAKEHPSQVWWMTGNLGRLWKCE